MGVGVGRRKKELKKEGIENLGMKRYHQYRGVGVTEIGVGVGVTFVVGVGVVVGVVTDELMVKKLSDRS